MSATSAPRRRPIELAQAVAYKLLGVLGYLKAFIPYLNVAEPDKREPETEPEPPAGGTPRGAVPHTVPAFPSLFDVASSAAGTVEGRHEDALLEAVEAWPQSRVSVLHQVRAAIRQHIEAAQRVGKLLSIADIFDNIDEVGSGVYGKVSVACLRGPRRGRCSTFTLDIPGLPAPTTAVVYLAVKEIRRVYGLPGRVVHENMVRGKYVGSINVMREVLLGRFLNYLVQAQVTPHLPFVYETFDVAPAPATAIAMELCHLDFHTFLNKILPRIADSVLRQKMLYVSLLQLAHALACSQARLDFRHNDLHSKNAMMTFITNSTYTYKVQRASYTVPNFGMCWKLTDFGFGSSAFLFNSDDSLVALRHTRAAEAVPARDKYRHHAVEMADFLRLLHNARKGMEAWGLRGEAQLCDTIEDTIHALAVSRPELAGSLHLFRNVSRIPQEAEGLEEMSRSHGLMTELFTYLATPFLRSRTHDTHADEVVYDMAAPLFQGGLTGIERRYYALHESGRLGRIQR